MAKISSIERNKKREKLNDRLETKRKSLKVEIMKKELPLEKRFDVVMKLAKMPRNSAKNRLRNRCGLTGRPRGYFRKIGLSRIKLRELAAAGMLPGIVKSSW